MNNDEIKQELEDILPQIKTLVLDAKELLQGTSERSRAESYWIAQILTALDDRHEYLGGSMVTMQNTIEALGEN